MKEIKPNFTQVPNIILDNIYEFSLAEFAVLSVICRQTYGWHKDKDRISLSQFKEKSGLSKQGIINAISSLQKKGWIVIAKTKIGNYYAITTPLVNSVDQGSQLSVPPLVNSVDIQNKLSKETKQNKDDAKASLVLEYFNKVTNSRKTLTDSRRRMLKATIKDYGIKALLYSIHNMQKDTWSIANKEVSIDRLIRPNLRDRNIDKFGVYPFKKYSKSDREEMKRLGYL